MRPRLVSRAQANPLSACPQDPSISLQGHVCPSDADSLERTVTSTAARFRAPLPVLNWISTASLLSACPQDPSSISLHGHVSPSDADSHERTLTPAAARLPEQGALSSLQGVGSSHSRVFVGVGDKVVGAIDVQVRLIDKDWFTCFLS